MFTKDFFETAPHSPGVYLMLDKKSAVLYVGKAKDLYKRLSSYARFGGSDHSKTTVMLSQVDRVDTLVTRTEKEALILEASLIKKHNPKYNIILRDDKNYPLIKVTIQEDWPRVVMARRRKNDNARYFGPYSSSSAMWSTLKVISKYFPLRRCKGKTLKPRTRPCLNNQLGQCLAPCTNDTVRELYDDNVKKVIMILEGKNKDLLEQLTQQMKEFSENLNFEQAAKRRDQISALSKTLEKQVVATNQKNDQDIFGFIRKEASVAIAILIIRSGVISASRTHFISDPFGDDQAILSQVVNQFYFYGDNLPKEIILPLRPHDLELFEERFSDLRGSKVSITVPKRGDKYQLLQMAQLNSQKVFEEKDKKEESWHHLRKALLQRLKLTKEPQTVECVDISNTSGKLAVGSLVKFREGEPDKSGYRHYRIQTIDSPDDYTMMSEVLERRFLKGKEENNLPDLFMVDGGKGQLNIACHLAKKHEIFEQIDLIGIAKEKDEEGEKLYKPGRKNPIVLKSHDPALLYLMRIRDESHRFGVTFHRKLRNKKTLGSELDKISGVGPARKKDLLKTLGSLKKVESASLEELEKVPGIGKELALQIYNHFNNN